MCVIYKIYNNLYIFVCVSEMSGYIHACHSVHMEVSEDLFSPSIYVPEIKLRLGYKCFY